MSIMASLPSKPKQQRKTKTSILFQVKQNTQHNIEFGQSLNIISLNTNNKINKRNTQINSNKYQNPIQCNTSTNINKNNVRRVYQSAKFSFKVNQNGNIGEDDENRIVSIYNNINTQKKLEKVNVSQLIEKYQKRHLINWEKDKIVTDLDNFTCICVEFLDKIEGLQVQNIEMVGKIKKFQNYFKQLKAKQVPQVLDVYLQPTTTKQQKNSQLKILNLQRKIQTLSYIIKKYRSGNKEQVKQFQKKLNEYKPTIQSQLLQILTQSNIKCQELSKLVQYFNKQYKKYCHQGNWVQLVRSLYDKDEKIRLLENRNMEILQQYGKLEAENKQANIFKEQLQKQNKQNMELSFQLTKLKTNHEQLNTQKLKKEIQNDEILRKLQDLSYKYQALLFIQPKLKQKEEIIRKNTQTINRIQNQNLVLINKMGTLIRNSQIQLFNKQQNSIETIEKCSITIEELTNRFKEQLQTFAHENKQLTCFIMHLYDKTKNSFQKMVEQYQKQLKQCYLQNKQLRNRLNAVMTYNQKRQQFCKDLFIQIKNIQTKRKRCEQSQSKIQIKQQCNSCLTWILHWGQLNSLYTQLLGAVKNLNQEQQ